MKQKLYQYKKPSTQEGKKAPFILCYANNEAHAVQVLRDRFNGEFIDKSLIEEYANQPEEKKSPKKKKKYVEKVSDNKKK